jgi:hypothetical protein
MRRSWALAVVPAAALLGCLSVARQPAARASALRKCRADDLAIKSTDARRRGRDVVVVTALGTWGTSACSARLRLKVTVIPSKARFSTGKVVRGIKGNPAMRTVRRTLEPGSVIVLAWRWRNWCGKRGAFALQPIWGKGDLVPSQRVGAPACRSRKRPSTLSRTKASVHVCTRSDYTAKTDLGQPFEGQLIDYVQIAPRVRRGPCLLKRARIDFAVQGETGPSWVTLGQIEGNPATRTIGGMLTPTYGAAEAFWAWANWCGGGDHFRALASVNSRSVTGPTEMQGPACQDSRSPSTLTANYGHL